jgi:CarD family transcriptional regulator
MKAEKEKKPKSAVSGNAKGASRAKTAESKPAAKKEVKKEGAKPKTAAAAKPPAASTKKPQPVKNAEKPAAKPKPPAKTEAAKSKAAAPGPKQQASPKPKTAAAKAQKSLPKEKPQKQVKETKDDKPAAESVPAKPKRKIAFKLNQKVVYPSQGVGKIVEVLEKKFNAKPLSYYKIYLEVSDMVIMVPVDKMEELGIRAIVKPAEAQDALEIIGQDVEPITSDWKLRYQMNLDLLKKGTVADIATIVRSLYHRSKVKELPVLERKLYDSAKKLLEDEISYSLNIPVKEVEAMIHARLEPAGVVRVVKQPAADNDFLDDDFPEESEPEKDEELPFEEDEDIGSDADEE